MMLDMFLQSAPSHVIPSGRWKIKFQSCVSQFNVYKSIDFDTDFYIYTVFHF